MKYQPLLGFFKRGSFCIVNAKGTSFKMSQWLYFIMQVNGQNQIANPAILVKNLIASPLAEENMSSKYPPNKVIVNMI